MHWNPDFHMVAAAFGGPALCCLLGYLACRIIRYCESRRIRRVYRRTA